ncbi:magnesium transporter [Butyrivibrio fibrisolvens DSM 3071]|uniref:Magnesium transporter n=1 Tax=Butyrivibrio fibrisolvens DSM 3071 TaxID=1121131 RepID=A0A1M5Z374_BUTFI|nr:CorA family divalent cation transporter [Butyrivibrio fibrisolvens]SHI18695.1 magnesium transporter [Butyrivibrio fibrisolvens DSM 3071]
MKSYKIKEKLEPIELKSYKNLDFQYVVVMTNEEWKERGTDFDMGIEWDIYFRSGSGTRAEVNYDSITGKFSILDRHDMPNKAGEFTFSLDEKGIIFVDDNGLAAEIIEKIATTKKLFNPCLERFLYDFLEQIIYNDAELLASYDRNLDEIEKQIFGGHTDNVLMKIAEIRNHLRDLKIHYLELMDVCQEFEENENEFFMASNERYFHLVNQRIQRLYERVTSLVEFTIQLREFCQSKTDEKQNSNLAYLTVISSIFMPLTLIVGWYGMNFKYMPELDEKWAYPFTGIVCVLIVVVCVTFFKKKKLL